MTQRNLKPITLGLVVGSREFFNGAPALATRAQTHRPTREARRRLFDPAGRGDEERRRAVARGRAHLRRAFSRVATTIDGLVICLPNFGDEIAIMELVNEARLGVPILLQASNDEIDKVDVASRRDAFCGKFSVANNFYQYGVPFTDTTSHTSDVDGEEFAADLDRFVRVCRVVRGLQQRPHRRHRRAHRRVPDHALQREAAAGLRPDGRHRRSLRNHSRRAARSPTMRPKSRAMLERNRRLWPHPRAHQA